MKIRLHSGDCFICSCKEFVIPDGLDTTKYIETVGLCVRGVDHGSYDLRLAPGKYDIIKEEKPKTLFGTWKALKK